jgi:hypothetical protein
LDGFPRFMADRAEVERWKQTFALYFGEVKGAPTPGWLGLHPGA